MKICVIDGRNGCKEIDVNSEDINGVTKDKKLRLIFVNKIKYRLTLKSYKELIKNKKYCI